MPTGVSMGPRFVEQLLVFVKKHKLANNFATTEATEKAQIWIS